jgi:hypothetical protein
VTLHNESPKCFWQDGTSSVFELARNVIQSTIREIYMDRAEAEQFLFLVPSSTTRRLLKDHANGQLLIQMSRIASRASFNA